MALLRVVVAEDSLLVRAGIRLLVEAEPSLELVGVHHDLGSLLAGVDADPPDVVLTDIRMLAAWPIPPRLRLVRSRDA